MIWLLAKNKKAAKRRGEPFVCERSEREGLFCEAKNGISTAVIKEDEDSNFHRLDAIYTKQARAKELDNNSNFKLRCYVG